MTFYPSDRRCSVLALDRRRCSSHLATLQAQLPPLPDLSCVVSVSCASVCACLAGPRLRASSFSSVIGHSRRRRRREKTPQCDPAESRRVQRLCSVAWLGRSYAPSPMWGFAREDLFFFFHGGRFDSVIGEIIVNAPWLAGLPCAGQSPSRTDSRVTCSLVCQRPVAKHCPTQKGSFLWTVFLASLYCIT